jgi:hypothetical protein
MTMAETIEQRPVHVVVDCSGPEWVITETPLTDGEWAEHKRISAEHEAATTAAAANRVDLATQVAAHPDPLVQLLARKAGLA